LSSEKLLKLLLSREAISAYIEMALWDLKAAAEFSRAAVEDKSELALRDKIRAGVTLVIT